MTNMTKERPVLFKDAMVRAILNGTKTQTRRIVKPQPETRPGMMCTRLIFKDRKGLPLLDEALEAPEPLLRRALCPYGQPGERLWVREAWAAPHAFDHLPPSLIPSDANFHYAADDSLGGLLGRPSIHMPRWASRITLEITGVRVERLQDISEADAMAEGIERDAITDDWSSYGQFVGAAPTPKGSYRALWESINGPGSWDANPWVWVIEFKRV